MKSSRIKRFGKGLLAFLMIVSSLYNASTVQAKTREYTLEEIKNVTKLPVINVNIENGADLVRAGTKTKQNATFQMINTNGMGEDIQLETTTEDGKTVWPVTIKGRGNSSWSGDGNIKKPYNLKFEKKQDLLGLGEAKKWCLIASWSDTSFMRNYLAYKLAKAVDPNAPDCEFVEFCVNGKYEGIYLLTEAYEIKKNRVEIPEDEGTNVTGGEEKTEFLIEADSRAETNNEPNRFKTTSGVWMVLQEPDDEEITTADDPRFTYIQKYMNTIDQAIVNTNNYDKYIDVESLVNLYLVNEFAKNPDFGFGNQPCYSSTFMYMREGGILHFGPVWDFDVSFGRNDFRNQAQEGNRDTYTPEGFLTQNTHWIRQLFTDSTFEQKVKEQWQAMRPHVEKVINELAPAAKEKLAYTQQYDFNTWGTYRSTGYNYRDALGFDGEYNYVINFMKKRAAWLDSQWNIVNDYENFWVRGEVTDLNGKDYQSLTANSQMQFADEALINGNVSDGIKELYDEVKNQTIALDNHQIWDGGYGFNEEDGTDYIAYGQPQDYEDGSIDLKESITITGPNNNVSTWWKDATGLEGSFGGQTNRITIEEAGRYVYANHTKNWWFNSGQTYTMGDRGAQIYVIDVNENGDITLYDGVVETSSAGRSVKTTNTTYGNIEYIDDHYVLTYYENQNGNAGTTISGGADTTFGLKFADEFNQEALEIILRPETSIYKDEPLKVESTYIYYYGAKPIKWTIEDPSIIEFDSVTGKVTAKGTGTTTITATTANGKTASIVVNSKCTKGEVSKYADPTKGLYYQDVSGIKQEAGHWATFLENTMTRYTTFFDIDEKIYDDAELFLLATLQKDQIIGGKADYYVYVNGNPFFLAGNNSLGILGFDKKVSLSNDQDAISGYERYSYMNGVHGHTETVMEELKTLLHSGANQIDIFVYAKDGGAMVRPYVYSGSALTGDEEISISSIKVSPTKVTLTVGETQTISTIITPDNAVNKQLNWISSDDTVAEVTDGKITANGAGEAIITVSSVKDPTKKAEVKVTVKEKKVNVSNVSVSKTLVTLDVGESETVTAIITPENATNKGVRWTTSDASVVTVENGKITAVGAGTAYITVTSMENSTKKAYVSVIVDEVEVTPSDQLAPAFDKDKATYPAGSVVYSDGKYYVYTDAWGRDWNNTGKIDSSWTLVETDLTAIPTIGGLGVVNKGKIVKVGNYYYTPLNDGSYTHWIAAGKHNAYWNCITQESSKDWK